MFQLRFNKFSLEFKTIRNTFNWKTCGHYLISYNISMSYYDKYIVYSNIKEINLETWKLFLIAAFLSPFKSYFLNKGELYNITCFEGFMKSSWKIEKICANLGLLLDVYFCKSIVDVFYLIYLFNFWIFPRLHNKLKNL